MNKTLSGIVLVFIIGLPAFGQTVVIPENVNSPYDEQNPIVDEGSGILYFTRSKHPGNAGGRIDEGDIWYSVREGAGWSEPKNARKLNNGAWNGIIGITPNGDMLLYGHYNRGGPVRTQGIAISKKNGNSFSAPQNIDIPYFKNSSKLFGGSISKDGNVLLLSIEGYGTKGTEDIYVCFKDGGIWSEPKNLGNAINTRFQELTPSINASLDTLYFSSNGHKGNGSSDVFMSIRKDDTWLSWSKPEPIDRINSTGRETGFRKYGGFSVFTSTLNSDGFGDIRFVFSANEDSVFSPIDNVVDTVRNVSLEEVDKEEVSVNPNDFTLYGNVRDQSSRELIDATVSVVKEQGDFSTTVGTDKSGKRYSLVLPSAGNYVLKVSAPEYISYQEKLEVFSTQIKLLNKDFSLQKIEVGARVNLENVLFEQSKAVIEQSSFEELNSVVGLLRENPTIKIRLEGHTDNRGNARQNLKLSKERVEAVKSYLVKRGISKRRVSGKGYGGSRPIADNSNLESRKLNRRVEFIILKD